MSKAVNRPVRTPLHKRNKITVADQDPSKKLRWVVDDEDRVEAFKEAGYSPVQKPAKVGDNRADSASQIGSVVERPAGGGKRMILMQIDRELFDEDQRDKEKELRKTESSITPKIDEENEGNPFYGGAKIKSEHARNRIQNIGDDE